MNSNEDDAATRWAALQEKLADAVLQSASNPVVTLRLGREKPKSVSSRARSLDDLRMRDHTADLWLKRILGFGSCGILAVQIGIMDWFVAWNLHALHGKVSAPVLITAVAGTIIEVIGVVLVIAKYLFPPTGMPWNTEDAIGERTPSDSPSPAAVSLPPEGARSPESFTEPYRQLLKRLGDTGGFSDDAQAGSEPPAAD